MNLTRHGMGAGDTGASALVPSHGREAERSAAPPGAGGPALTEP